MKKYIIIGAIPTKSVESYGGTTILVKQMLGYFSEANIPFVHIETNRFESKYAFFFNFCYVVIRLLKHIKTSDLVMVNVARNGAFILSPVLMAICKTFGKKFIFRMFGGNFITLYRRSWMRRVVSDVSFLKADLIFAETNAIVSFLKQKNSSTYWFPNTRRQEIFPEKSGKFSKRFVFISSVKQTKGVDEIIEACKRIDHTYFIDIYGPIQDEKYSESYFETNRINYKGVLKPHTVLETLSNYDVLLLPTYHPGEGYPGIIIECYSLGIPCIVTDWQAIPEIVEHEKTGILIKPQSAEALVNAILYFNCENYSTFSQNARDKFEEFRYENVYKKITDICESV